MVGVVAVVISARVAGEDREHTHQILPGWSSRPPPRVHPPFCRSSPLPWASVVTARSGVEVGFGGAGAVGTLGRAVRASEYGPVPAAASLDTSTVGGLGRGSAPGEVLVASSCGRITGATFVPKRRLGYWGFLLGARQRGFR